MRQFPLINLRFLLYTVINAAKGGIVMNIGIRLHDTAGTSMEEHLQSANAQGFTCAHIAMQKVIPGFKMMDAPTLLTTELAQQSRELMQRYNLQFAVLGCYLNLATPDQEELERTVNCYKAHLRFAREVGALVVGTETGAPNVGYKTCPECWTDESLHLFIDRVRPVVKAAEEEGAILAIEPVCRHIVSTPERAQRVLEAIDSPNLQIILDAINLLNPANCGQADAIIADAISRFGDRIRILHMKDYQVVAGKTDVASMACGTGVMDYTRLLNFAKDHPGIPMTLEDTRPDNAVAARLHLENLVK